MHGAASLAAAIGVALSLLGSQSPAQIAQRAEDAFAAVRLSDALAAYDQLGALVPSAAPELWQRGVVLYYLGRYDECAAQFAAFFKINQHDSENAAWHFFCEARGHSEQQARTELLHVGEDTRIVRKQIHDLVR